MRVVTHYNYTAWNDHSTPESNSSLVNFIVTVRSDVNSKNTSSPILVHCSGGVGRTGTFIAIDHSILLSENFEKIDVFGIVSKLRRERCLSVQTEVSIND